MLEKFHWTRESSGEEITLPKFDQVPFGIIRKARKAEEQESMFMLIEGMADDEALAVIDKMLPDEITAFMEAWQQDAGVTSGESEDSAKHSKTEDSAEQ